MVCQVQLVIEREQRLVVPGMGAEMLMDDHSYQPFNLLHTCPSIFTKTINLCSPQGQSTSLWFVWSEAHPLSQSLAWPSSANGSTNRERETAYGHSSGRKSISKRQSLLWCHSILSSSFLHWGIRAEGSCRQLGEGLDRFGRGHHPWFPTHLSSYLRLRHFPSW